MYLDENKWTFELIDSETYLPPFFFDSISKASFEYAGALMMMCQHFQFSRLLSRETSCADFCTPNMSTDWTLGTGLGWINKNRRTLRRRTPP